MDTDSYYFIKAEKKQYIPYEQYPELPVHDDMPDTDGTSHAHGHSHTQTKAVMNRLARISGHLEAIKRMVEDGRDCSDILIQISAVDSALVSVGKVILRDHIDHCIIDAVKDNDMEAVDNLKKAITRFYQIGAFMELQDRARAVGQRWDYCAAGYDKIIEEERKTQEDCWLQLLMTHRPVRSGTSRRRYGAGFCHSHAKPTGGRLG